MKGGWKPSPARFLILAGLLSAVRALPIKANVSLVYFNTFNRTSTNNRCECGMFGVHSPVTEARGLVVLSNSSKFQACTWDTHFAPAVSPWIALVARGNCTFTEKIKRAARLGAAAVVIYNYAKHGNNTIHMAHPGTGNTVAIMISYAKGREILQKIERGYQVTMAIEVGKKHGSWMNNYSIFFVSVSFFIVTAATVGYFIFYSARRLRVARAQNRRQRRLKADARKAIGQLQLRTLKQGDEETGPDADSCAVCIEAYKPNDVVRILTCNHLFHKSCIDPWLLEHRTCPMCKCDILKALGIEVDIEERGEATQAPTASSEASNVVSANEEDNHSETASSGYASVQGTDEPAPEERVTPESDHLRLVNASQTPDVETLPHLDNPAFEGDETPEQPAKS
ncbi:E3 ubiquitin-protein ligase RNF128 isoform X2 [Pantherophis guttatus]|uniref:E3 ubiquitin-protein ligase RNF128 isoform X2 n=1 Tax=Pantherophis guttatus TaxID=94885 RepID=A0ABM3YND8_PANGU|nr:E3 ubiquitin-protein ligase RNF128 isoform X2 [Pantherophis guttatus]